MPILGDDLYVPCRFTSINLQLHINAEILTWFGTFKGNKGVSGDEILFSVNHLVGIPLFFDDVLGLA